MLYNTFSNLFNEDAPKSVADEKAALLTERTAEKQTQLDPFHAQTEQLFQQVTQNTTNLGNDLNALAQIEANQQQLAAQQTQAYTDKYDPNSPENIGKWFTTGEIENGGILSVPGIANLGAGLVKGVGDVAGMIAAAPANMLYSDSMKTVDQEAIPVYEKFKRNQALKGQLDSELAQMRTQLQSGAVTAEDINLRTLDLKKQIADTELTDQEHALLGAVPVNAPAGTTSNKDILAQAEQWQNTGKTLPAKIDNLLKGSEHFNSVASSKLSESISKRIDTDVAELNSAKDLINKGDYLEAAKKGLPALARVVYAGISEGIDNPNGAAQMIAENFADVMTARMGLVGLGVSALESVGMAAQMQADGVSKFIEQNGRKPTMDEFSRIGNWSAVAGALDMGSDILLSGAGKGMSKLLKSPVKTGIDEIRATAINQTAEEAAQAIASLGSKDTKSVAKAILSGTGKTVADRVVDTATEGLTEGAQQIIDDYTSELKPVGDLKDAALATAAGALVGAGMHPASHIVDFAGKTAQVAGKGVMAVSNAIADTAINAALPKSEERIKAEQIHLGRAEHDYENKVTTAATANDVSPYTDPKSETYRPILALDTLAKMNQSPDVAYTDKASNLEQALQIAQDFNKERYKRILQKEQLETKYQEKSITPDERKQLRDLRAVTDGDQQYMQELYGVISSMTKTEETPTELRTKLAEVRNNKNPEETDSVLKTIFGNNGGADIQSFGSDLEAIRQSTTATPETKQFVQDIQQLSKAKDTLDESIQKTTDDKEIQKTTDDVQNNVFNGDARYRGVTSYTQSIANALANGAESFATDELSKLENFAQTHRLKATTLRNVTEAIAAGNTPTPEDTQNLELLNSKRSSGPYKIDPAKPGWMNMIANIEKEADVLDAGVKVARGLFSLGRQTGTQPQVQSVSAAPTVPQQTPNAQEIHASNMTKDVSGLTAGELRSAALRKRTKATNYPQGSKIRNLIEAEADYYEEQADLKDQALPQAPKVAQPAQADPAPTGKTSNVRPTPVESKLAVEPQVKQPAEKGQVLSPAEIEGLTEHQPSTLVKGAIQAKMADGRTAIRLVDKTGKPVKPWTTYDPKAETDPVTVPDQQPASVVNTAEAQPQPKSEAKDGNERQEEKQGRQGLLSESADKADTTAQTETPASESSEPVVTVAAKATQSSTTDPQSTEDYRLSNIIRRFFKPRKNGKTNLLQTNDNFFTKAKTDIQSLFTDKENAPEFDDNAVKLIGSMVQFHEKFAASAHKIFQPFTEKGQVYAYKDFMQYLDVDGVLPESIVNIMSATAFKWLATRSKETLFNDTDTIQKILGLKEEDQLTAQAHKLLSEVGVTQNMLVETLGKEAYRLLGIKADKTAPDEVTECLQNSLGLQIIATLEDMRLLQTTTIFTGKFSKPEQKDTGTFGIDALKANVLNYLDPDYKAYNLSERHAFFVDPAVVDTTNRTRSKFYRIASAPERKNGYLQPSEAIQPIMDQWKTSQRTWDSLFSADEDNRMYSWQKHEYSDNYRAKIEGTNQFATKYQTDNVINNSNKGWTQSVNTMNAFLFLDQQNQLNALGYKDPEQEHVDAQESVKDKNASFIRDIEALSNWLTDAGTQPDGRNSVFYIPAQITRNMRMGQKGPINPQNSKLHRYVFGMPEWKTTFTLGDTTMEDRFLEAVGLSFGVEASKKGGLDNVKKELNYLLNDPIADSDPKKDDIHAIREAISALQNLMNLADTQDLSDPQVVSQIKERYPHLEEDIVKGVKAGGEKMHTFKGLLEYARYRTAKQNGATEFTTDIASEIDGMSNGPILGRIQFLLNWTKEHLTMLRNGGLSLSSLQNDVGVHLNSKAQMDPYQAGGMAWSEALEGIISGLLRELRATNKKDTYRALALKQELSRITAAKRILGEFNDEDGFVVKLVRSLTKSPVMTTMYGSGEKALIKKLTRTLTEETIYDKLKTISKMTDGVQAKEKLDALATDLATLANLPKGTKAEHYFMVPANVINRDGSVNAKAILKLRIPKMSLEHIYNHIQFGHGKALSLGIDKIYGDIKRGRKDLNLGFTIATALYNVAREQTIANYKAKKKLPIVRIEDGVTHYADLSTEDYAEIDKQLQQLYPTLTTPFGGKMDMAQNSNEKDYGNNRAIEQSYNSERLPNSRQKRVQQKTAFLTKQAKLENPGVSPVVLSIQMLDATISNLTQGMNLSVLNCHDGFFTGINQIAEVNKALNQNMHEVLTKYNLVESMYNSVKESIDAFNEYRQNNETNPGEWDAAIDKQFRKFGITEFKNNDGSKIDLHDGDPETAINDVLASMKGLADIATSNKQKLFEHVTRINHYYYPNGGFETGIETPQNDTQAELDALDSWSEDNTTTRATNLAKQQTDNTGNITEMFAEYVNEVRDKSKLPQSTYVSKGAVSVSPTSQRLGIASTRLNSNANASISMDEADYDVAIPLTRQNAVDTYDGVKNIGTVQVSPGHDKHLRRIMFSLVAKVMNPAEMFLKTSAATDTAGLFETDGQGKDRLFLSAQRSGILAQGIKMSAGEVYVHELIHAITYAGLKQNAQLRRNVNSLYQLAKKTLNADGQGWRYFLNDPTLDTNDPLNTAEIEDAKKRWDYIFETPWVRTERRYDSATDLTQTKQYSQHLDEFMAHGLTNEQFIQALRQIQLTSYKGEMFNRNSWQGLKGRNIQETLLNILNRVMDVFMHNFTVRVPAANMAVELEQLAHRLADIDNKQQSILFNTIEKVDTYNSKLGQYIDGHIKSTFSKLHLVEAIQDAKQRIERRDSPTGALLRKYRNKIDGMDYGMTQSIITSMRGLTDRLKDLHLLLNTKGILVDKAREEATANVIATLRNLWGKDLQAHEKVSLLKAAIKTDLDVLRLNFSMQDIQAMVDPDNIPEGQKSTLEQAIQETQRQISVDEILGQYAHYYAKQAQSLGFFLVHGQSLESSTFLNAHLIASLSGTKHAKALNPEQIAKAEELVDQLATLYAVKFTPIEHRVTLRNLMNDNMVAVEAILQLHRDLQLDAQDSLFNGQPYQVIKGYTKDITNPQINIKIAPASKESELREQEYVRSPYSLSTDPHDPNHKEPLYFYIARTGAENDLLSTIASYTGNAAKGTSITESSMIRGNKKIRARSDNTGVVFKKITDLNAMFNNPVVPFDPTEENIKALPNYLIPQVDSNGFITNYRYMMKESTKDGLLEKHNEYDAVLGSMAGQIKDKLGTRYINGELIGALKDLYDSEYSKRGNAYVEISPYTVNPKHREIYHMLPYKAKQQIKQIWGDNKMFVAKDVVDLAFGTRRYSLVEAFGKDPQARSFVEKVYVEFARQFFGNNKITQTRQIEDILRGITKIAKNNIIVKSFTVSWNNHVSNLLYCKGRGVGFNDILRWKREAVVNAVKYQADRKALQETETRLSMNNGRKPTAQVTKAQIEATSKQLEARIRELQNELALNPVNDVMDAGLLQTIVDDVETSNVQSPYPSLLEKQMTKFDKFVPAPIETIGKHLLLTNDTQAYKVLNNAVKLTDFIGRYIMYKHYTNPKRGKNRFGYETAIAQGAKTEKQIASVIHRESIAQVINEFINFNLPSHRVLEYMNSTVGVLWFTKYALGVLKPIKDMVKDKPFEAISTFILAHVLGLSSVFESIPFVTKNPMSVFGNPISALIESYDDIMTLHAAESMLDSIRQ